MSNHLSATYGAARREAHELPRAPSRGFALGRVALRWLRDVVRHDGLNLSPAMRRDLGLPEMAAAPFVYDAERSRARV